MSDNLLLTPQDVAELADEGARQFLVRHGLPRDHDLFAAAEPVLWSSITDRGVHRRLLKVGEGGPTDEFCVDCRTGEVVSLNRVDGSVWHVCRSVPDFAACLERFSSGQPFGDDAGDRDATEAAADGLREALVAIDPTCLREDPGFWYTVLHDVAIGDYAEE